MLVPLSGPWARQGILEKMGAEMAVDDVNNAGGIKALGGAKLKLLEFDTQDTAEKAKDAAQRMLAQNPDVVGGFGCWLSTFTLAVTEVTERAHLPWLTLSYSDLITARGYQIRVPVLANRRAAGRGHGAGHHGDGREGNRQAPHQGCVDRRQHRRVGQFPQADRSSRAKGPEA